MRLGWWLLERTEWDETPPRGDGSERFYGEAWMDGGDRKDEMELDVGAMAI